MSAHGPGINRSTRHRKLVHVSEANVNAEETRSVLEGQHAHAGGEGRRRREGGGGAPWERAARSLAPREPIATKPVRPAHRRAT